MDESSLFNKNCGENGENMSWNPKAPVNKTTLQGERFHCGNRESVRVVLWLRPKINADVLLLQPVRASNFLKYPLFLIHLT